MNANEKPMARYPLPENARCGACGGADLSPVPKFFAGMGTSYAPFNEGVLCRKCGCMGAFALVRRESEQE